LTARRFRAAFEAMIARASRLRISVVRQSVPNQPNSRWASETHNERHSRDGRTGHSPTRRLRRSRNTSNRSRGARANACLEALTGVRGPARRLISRLQPSARSGLWRSSPNSSRSHIWDGSCAARAGSLGSRLGVHTRAASPRRVGQRNERTATALSLTPDPESRSGRLWLKWIAHARGAQIAPRSVSAPSIGRVRICRSWPRSASRPSRPHRPPDGSSPRPSPTRRGRARSLPRPRCAFSGRPRHVAPCCR
jgi:hypothetical protein